MQHQLLVGTLTVTTAAVTAVFFFLYFETLQEVSMSQEWRVKPEGAEFASVTLGRSILSTPSWVTRFSTTPKTAFVFPTPELQIRLDLLPSQDLLTKRFRVIVGNLDSYGFFCLNQVLLSNNIQYTYYKTETETHIIVTAKEKKSLDTILQQLGRYNISYRLQEF